MSVSGRPSLCLKYTPPCEVPIVNHLQDPSPHWSYHRRQDRLSVWSAMGSRQNLHMKSLPTPQSVFLPWTKQAAFQNRPEIREEPVYVDEWKVVQHWPQKSLLERPLEGFMPEPTCFSRFQLSKRKLCCCVRNWEAASPSNFWQNSPCPTWAHIQRKFKNFCTRYLPSTSSHDYSSTVVVFQEWKVVLVESILLLLLFLFLFI